jgi:hypothetical protein
MLILIPKEKENETNKQTNKQADHPSNIVTRAINYPKQSFPFFTFLS